MLAAWEKRYPTERAKVRTDIAIGMPAEEICRRVGRESFDLVVIGSRGLSASERILLGSVSARVARCCSCPVLIIR
jgi:nucleotide-binding universal stress UspA family protein